jgi:hypothetical protein
MSIVAMNWAWQLRLKPTAKFVLMALADAADDDGFCWPSIPTLARKTCLDDRSVQRIIKFLKEGGLVQVNRRFRRDGSPTSNGYLLPLRLNGDKLSPHLQILPRDPVAPSPPSDGGSVTQTTKEHTNESKPPQPGADRVGEGSSGLIFPKQLSPKEIALALCRLEPLSPALGQELLDELAGRLNAFGVRGSPMGYLRSLIDRAEAGTFTPEVGIRVALAREREKELAALKQFDSLVRSQQQRSSSPGEHLELLRKALISK